jgi:hypothetical protein
LGLIRNFANNLRRICERAPTMPALRAKADPENAAVEPDLF